MILREYYKTLRESTSEYWKSPAGITRRVEMLGEDFTYRLVNNALQVYGQTNKVKGWRWEGSIDERTCDYCYSKIMEDRLYRLGQFLPSLPAHAGCRCGWILIEK